jgi:hypothetical protein
VRVPGSARALRPGMARWLRYATVVVVTAGSAMLVSPAAPAWACSCVQPTPQQAAAVAGLVFAGVVRDLDRPAAAGSGDPVVVTFAVSEAYKGEVSATMRVRARANVPLASRGRSPGRSQASPVPARDQGPPPPNTATSSFRDETTLFCR